MDIIEINPAATAKKTIIWLHGLGADGSDFVPIVSELRLPPTLGIRFIFPHAPILPVTFNQGYKMRAWFDIYELSIDSKIDKAGIERSITSLHKIIENEKELGITPENIVLAGFSQGAVIALACGISYPKSLGGVIALSGFLPLTQEFLKSASSANNHIPIFIAHGTEDVVVPYALGKSTYVALKQAGYPIDWHSYKMAHSVCAEEIIDISAWIQHTAFNQK